MKGKRLGEIYWVLLASFVFGLSGLWMYADAYYTRISAAAASNQFEFMRYLPQLADKSEVPVVLPAYNSTVILEENKNLRLLLHCDLYAGRVSMRQAMIECRLPTGTSYNITTLLDARERK
ncbi:MAG: hypothetical protein LLG37_01015 [Spirochaetia bacterium]|nr:hypothetical protein [Spirochaetia bacterium]